MDVPGSPPPRRLYSIGWWFGLGALIQSTVNSIWLARKFGFDPVIWWGDACLYTPSGSVENTYALLFSTPVPEFTLSSDPLRNCYPAFYRENAPQTMIELQRWVVHAGQQSGWRREDRIALQQAAQVVCFQYLDLFLAWSLVHGEDHPVNMTAFDVERDAIFAEFFQPVPAIQQKAELFWKKNLAGQGPAVGIHIRGTDKHTEKAVPSAKRMIDIAIEQARRIGGRTLFLATDSEVALLTCQKRCRDQIALVYQSYSRGSSDQGLHFQKEQAHENAVSMIADIELLSRCEVIVAFPGSQIFWWLERKIGSGQSRAELVGCRASLRDWIGTLAYIWDSQGWKGSLNWLRVQKASFLTWFRQHFAKQENP